MKTIEIVFIFCLLAIQNAYADMELSPLRQVITTEAPEAVFAVSNPSRRILNASVNWVDLTATETGYAPASTQARKANSAAPFLTVSPAHFSLEPGGRMNIIVRLKDGVRVPRGERRSHLLIETAAARTPIRKASNNGLQVDVGLGMSAPVILRNGGAAKAKIGETKLLRDKEGRLLLATSILQGGDNSSYGRIEVFFKAKGHSDPEEQLGVRTNVAGFLDAASRRIDVPLGFTTLGPGELTVRYAGSDEYDGRIFDERTYDVAPPH